MTTQIVKDNGKVTLFIEGRIDSVTAPELDKAVNSAIGEASNLVFDFAKVEYISSAGLRVILAASKVMANKGDMSIINTSPLIKEIFDMTGFSDVLVIE